MSEFFRRITLAEFSRQHLRSLREAGYSATATPPQMAENALAAQVALGMSKNNQTAHLCGRGSNDTCELAADTDNIK